MDTRYVGPWIAEALGGPKRRRASYECSFAALVVDELRQFGGGRRRQPASGILFRIRHFSNRQLRAALSRFVFTEFDFGEHETRVSTLELVDGVVHAV